MTLRMVLVGLVAALGVTTPTPTQCGQWWSSIRSVGVAALADWDHWQPREARGSQPVFRLAPLALHNLPSPAVGACSETGPAFARRRTRIEAEGRPLIAAHHVKAPTPEEVAARDESETWPDLPGNVFDGSVVVARTPKTEPPAVAVQQPKVDSPNLAAQPPKVNSRAVAVQPAKTEAPAVAVQPAKTEAPAVAVQPAKTEAPAVAVQPPKVERGSVPVRLPAVVFAAGEAVNAEARNEAGPREVAFTQEPRASADDGRCAPADGLEASLFAGLLLSAETARGEKLNADSPSGQSASPVEAVSEAAAAVTIGVDDLADDDWGGEIAGRIDEPRQSVQFAGNEPSAGAVALDSDSGLDSDATSSTLSWSEATALAGQIADPGLGSDVPASQRRPADFADFKQAMQLTRDAFSAWMNLVRRGSTLDLARHE
jgi:hypothetical protein